jgi:hypothetical protein
LAAKLALSRPDMRFVPIKSEAQQAARGLERSRELLVKQHTRHQLRAQPARRVRPSSRRKGGVASPN